MPFDLIAGIAIAVLPLIAAGVLLLTAQSPRGGGAAIASAADLRSSIMNVAVAADEARTQHQVSLVDAAVGQVTSRRATLGKALTPEITTSSVRRDLSDLDKATRDLATSARAYATGTQDTGAGGTAYANANRALDDLMSDLPAALDATLLGRVHADALALALVLAGAAIGAGQLVWLWWRRRGAGVNSEWYRRRWRDSSLALPDVLFGADADGRITFVTDAVTQLFGWEPEHLVDRPLTEFLANSKSVSTDGEDIEVIDGEWRHRDGTTSRVNARILTRHDEEGEVLGTTGVILDPRPANAIAEALRESEERFRHTLDTAQNGMMIVSPDGRVILHNEALRKLVAYSAEELSGLTIGQLVPAADLDRVMALFAVRMWSDAAPSHDELRLVRRDGEQLDVEMSVTAFREGNRNEGVLVEVRDVTERRRATETIRYLAEYDTLTGLANRASFERQLEIAVMEARDAERSVGVLLIDLDRFKLINDTLGHAGGDRLLQAVAKRLVDALPRRYTVARFGGDEFLVLAPRLDRPEAIQHAAAQVMEALERPFDQDGKLLRVTGSIGGVLFPEHGEDADTLIKSAGAAMYEAKERGGSAFRTFDPSHFGSASDRLTLEAELQRAIEREEFRLYYQPVVDVATGRIEGAEALIRWAHPERGLLPAVDFVETLEETGQIIPVGEWVLNAACEQVQRWRAEGLPEIRIAVNLSARQFLAPELDLMVRRVLQHTGLRPAQLELEVTETTAMLNMDDARRVLETLRGIGVTAAIDDFGIGHSSLARLREFPVSTLKIDRSFVMHLDGSDEDPAIVRGVIALGHALGLSVVAEGIETEQQADLLREMGCDFGQGYFYARPVPADDFRDLLSEDAARAAA